LMAAIFLSAGTDTKMTSKAVLASAAGAAAAPAPAGAAAAAGAAAVTPQAVSSCLTKSAASITVNLPNCSTNADMSAILPFSLVAIRSRGRILLASPRADDLLCSCCFIHLQRFAGNEIVWIHCVLSKLFTFGHTGSQHTGQLRCRGVDDGGQLGGRRHDDAQQLRTEDFDGWQIGQSHYVRAFQALVL